MTLNPLQAVTEATNTFWQGLFQELSKQLESRVLEEELKLQVDMCHLKEDDPRLMDALIEIGAAARAFFMQHRIPVFWVQYPFLRPKILEDLDGFVRQFQALQERVAAEAHIRPHQWRKGEYSHDLSQIVGEKQHLFRLVQQFTEAPLAQQQAATGELAQQVKLAHKNRMQARQRQVQMG